MICLLFSDRGKKSIKNGILAKKSPNEFLSHYSKVRFVQFHWNMWYCSRKCLYNAYQSGNEPQFLMHLTLYILSKTPQIPQMCHFTSWGSFLNNMSFCVLFFVTSNIYNARYIKNWIRLRFNKHYKIHVHEQYQTFQWKLRKSMFFWEKWLKNSFESFFQFFTKNTVLTKKWVDHSFNLKFL